MFESCQKCDIYLQNNRRLAEIVYSYLISMPRLLLIAERCPPDGGLATSGTRIADSIFKLGIELNVLVWSRYLQAGKVQPLTNTFPFSVYRIGLYRHWDMTMTHTLNFLDWLHQQKP